MTDNRLAELERLSGTVGLKPMEEVELIDEVRSLRAGRFLYEVRVDSRAVRFVAPTRAELLALIESLHGPDADASHIIGGDLGPGYTPEMQT